MEKIIQLNLAQINAVCRAVHASAARGKLKASWTAYVKWGKGGRPPLRFTKSGDPKLERLWATHYLHPGLAAGKAEPIPKPPPRNGNDPLPASNPSSSNPVNHL